jgi:hypothetical protein
MTRDETKMILMRIQTTYPNWKPQGDLSLTIDVWHEYLEGYTYQEILGAVKAFVLTDITGFAPTVGQIVGKLHGMMKSIEPEINGLEAWAMVSKAIRNGYYGAEEEFEKLPPLVQKAVGSPQNLRNWSQTDMRSIETVVMSQFLSSYKAESIRASEYSKLPNNVKLEMQERLRLTAGE